MRKLGVMSVDIITRIRINRNPNYIDVIDSQKLAYDVIAYALKNGYVFNKNSIERFIDFPAYIEKFRETPEIIEYFVNDAIAVHSFDKVYNNLCDRDKSKLFKIIKDKPELNNLFIEQAYDLYKNKRIIDGNDILHVFADNEEKMYQVLKTHEDLLADNNIKEYLITQKSPSELYKNQIINQELEQEYIRRGTPENILYILENASESSINNSVQDIKRRIAQNPDQFYKYVDTINEKINSKANIEFISQDIKENIFKYILENGIPYNKEEIPKFVKDNPTYQHMVIIQNPKVAEVMQRDGIISNISFNEEDSLQIIKKINAEKIQFDQIPKIFSFNKEIFESVVKNNPDIFKNNEYIKDYACRVNTITQIRGMTDAETVEYCKQLGMPFNRNTAIYFNENALFIAEALRNDISTLSGTEILFSKEELKLIADSVKNVEPEKIVRNDFLVRNPYILPILVANKVDLSEIDISKTYYYEDFYNDLAIDAKQNGIKLPKPEKLQYQITPNGVELLKFDSLESLDKLIELVQKKGINSDIIINLDLTGKNEQLISDNLEKFEQLQQMISKSKEENQAGVTGINFKYENGKNVFTLEKVLEDEHFLKVAAEEINSRSFSPLEKTIAVYDIVKNFKPYAFEDKDSSSAESRQLYEIMQGDAMVCFGYANLMQRLGHMTGLNIAEIGVVTDELHSRNYTYIKDEKYGIDGYYALDPTWEHSRTNRTYKRIRECEKYL